MACSSILENIDEKNLRNQATSNSYTISKEILLVDKKF